MGTPEERAWLEDLPEEWNPPADMKNPTSNPGLNLPVQMLSSSIIGNDLIELVGLLVAEGARFNMWFAAEAKPSAIPHERLALLSLASIEQTRKVYEGWREYVDAFELANGLVGAAGDERSKLRAALSESVAQLVEVRNRLLV